jgi:hypothetical protein
VRTSRATDTKRDRKRWENRIIHQVGKGWFTIIRLYSPLQPFFDKTWRPSEIELV